MQKKIHKIHLTFLLILNLLSKYLVFSIAKNIVLPMKNIKKILDKMNQNDEFINQDEIKPQITNSEEGKNDNTVNDDTVCLTNLNRQIHATYKTISQSKVEVMKERK